MNRIKCLRMSRNLSQAAFAKLFNIDQTAVSNWENNKNSIDVKIAQQIADEFSVPMEFVYGVPFKLENPIENWHQSLLEDYYHEPEPVRDLLLFKIGRGRFNSNIDETTPYQQKRQEEFFLTEQEKTLLAVFRETTEEGRMEMIAAIINIKKAIEAKRTASSDSALA